MFTFSKLGQGVAYLFLLVSSFVMVYPVLFVLLGAFTTNDRFNETAFLPLPNSFSVERLGRAFEALQGAYVVTLVRVAFYLGMTVFVGLIAGYIFSKMRFPGRDRVFLLLLLGMVVPAILVILPQYILAVRFPFAGGNDWLGQGGHGFAGEWPVLFLYGWVPPFAIFLLKQNFDMLPTEYEDAAKMDGAGMFTIIFRVYGPMLRPPVAALVILTFLSVWNDYLWPSLTIAGNPAWYPVSFKIAGIAGQYPGPGMFMRFLMVMWPPAAVFFLLQRNFVQGLVASGLKG